MMLKSVKCRLYMRRSTFQAFRFIIVYLFVSNFVHIAFIYKAVLAHMHSWRQIRKQMNTTHNTLQHINTTPLFYLRYSITAKIQLCLVNIGFSKYFHWLAWFCRYCFNTVVQNVNIQNKWIGPSMIEK